MKTISKKKFIKNLKQNMAYIEEHYDVFLEDYKHGLVDIVMDLAHDVIYEMGFYLDGMSVGLDEDLTECKGLPEGNNE